MIFKRELAEKIVAGEKTATRRSMSDNPRSPWYRGGCKYRVGQVFAVQPGRGETRIADARVTKVVSQAPLYISGEQARAEGFAGSKDFHAAFRAINPGIDLREPVWVIEFELVDPTSQRAA
jgi:hypothetical protein